MSISQNIEGFNTESAEEVNNNLPLQEQVTDDDLLIDASSSALESPDVTDEDIDECLVPQDFADQLQVSVETSAVEIRKPSGMEYNRVHQSWQPYRAFLIKGKLGKYFVLQSKLYRRYSREAKPHLLIPTIDLSGDVFLWPIRMPGAAEQLDAWSKKARQAADLARGRWIRIIANKQLSGYDVEFPEDSFEEPIWPKDVADMRHLLKIAFRDIIIRDENHPVLQKVRGKNVK